MPDECGTCAARQIGMPADKTTPPRQNIIRPGRRSVSASLQAGRCPPESGEVLGHHVPVHQLPESAGFGGCCGSRCSRRAPTSSQVSSRVLPVVSGGGIAGGHQIQRTIGRLHQPGPARTKGASGRRVERLLNSSKLPHLALIAQPARQSAHRRRSGTGQTSRRLVSTLGGVAEDAAAGFQTISSRLAPRTRRLETAVWQ